MFIARGKEDALVTHNLVPGDAAYGEKWISVNKSPWTLGVNVRYLFCVLFLNLIYLFKMCC